jgi:hypothetical protein
MFNRIRMRLTYANVAMTLALVFAMTGGAYAAKKYLITSTKQISPSVLKALAGKPGPAGAAGAPGAAGAAGKDGAQGPKGDTGAEGKQGIQGLEGKEGKVGATGVTGPGGAKGATGATGPTGVTGTTGSPWTAGGTLPSGKTETGSWTVTIGSEGFGFAGMSLSIPLAKTVEASFIEAGKVGGTGCTGGTAAKPKADPGHFCVYADELFIFGTPEAGSIVDAGSGAIGQVGAGSGGAVMIWGGEPGLVGGGTFAVTAE